MANRNTHQMGSPVRSSANLGGGKPAIVKGEPVCFAFVDVASGRAYVCERKGNRFEPSVAALKGDADPNAVMAKLNALPKLRCRVKQMVLDNVHQVSSAANSPNIVTGDWQSVHPGMRMRRSLLGPDKEAR